MASVDVKQLRVLIVEDNLHFRTLVRTILQALGVTSIEEAKDGAEALEILQSFPADLAILDWKMDGIDGVECMRRIRNPEMNSNPYLAVIMVTGYTEAKLVTAARDAGVNDFLAKPISAKSLLSRIISVFEKPRVFIKTDSYFGPDRRRRAMPIQGEDRRVEQTNVVTRETD